MRRAASGFTLAEVLLASVLAAVALVAVTTSMSSATSSKAALAREPELAARLAEEIHVLAETLSSTPSGSVAATQGADVLALDSLAGAVFSPPLLADRSADAALPAWKQSVSLALYALDDLDTPTGEDVTAEVPSHSPRVYRLSVRVSQSGSTVGTWHWWVRP